MITTQRIIYCTNANCPDPVNSMGDDICLACQTPLVYRYLWATGASAAKIPLQRKVDERYEVVAPQIWLDTEPGKLPNIPEELPQLAISYLRLHPYRLHLPQLYGFVSSGNILLLENVPIDESGNLYPSITYGWSRVTAVRQVYWLWQILELWKPLSDCGVAASLVAVDNLRVQDWCVRLLELDGLPATLQQLGESWQPFVDAARPSVAPKLKKIVQQMRDDTVEFEDIAHQLNHLLLSTVGELPLSIKIIGATDTGGELTQNEDACFPNSSDFDEQLLPRFSIVCDGIGGHEGGEIASKLAVQSFKLQVRALLNEVAEQTEFLTPTALQNQLEASLRIVNNLICTCNNEQNRSGTQRMGTTVIMAIQVPQRVQTASGFVSENTHELYLLNVGDSRAYWFTRNYCQLLTLDDDVTAREVYQARSVYRKALQRPDATALTQAVGTKNSEFVRPRIQRFIIEEDGVLLLCSDGLSDNNLLEQSWREYILPILNGELEPDDTVRYLIELANEKNGHDNTSVTLSYCRVSQEPMTPATKAPAKVKVQPSVLAKVESPQFEPEPELELEPEPEPESEFAQSSQALRDLYTNVDPIATDKAAIPQKRGKTLLIVAGLLLFLASGTALSLFAWSRFSPQSFQQMCLQYKIRCPK